MSGSARWEADGTWGRLLEHAQVRDDAAGTIEWTVSVDSTVNRAHQHAAGARKKGRPLGTDWRIPNVVERCFGRLKQFRAVATRFDTLADRYGAGLHLACSSCGCDTAA